LGHLKITLLLLLILAISSASVFADSSGVLSVILGKTYQIHYEARDSQVQSVQVNKDSLSLIFSVQATSSNAYLQFTLPRELIDATKNDGSDDTFIVLVDGAFAAETESSPSSLTRTLLIPLTTDSKEIEIIGTHLGATSITLPPINNTQSTPSIPQKKPIEQKSSNLTSTINQSQIIKPGTPSLTPNTNSNQEENLLQKNSSLLNFMSGYLPLNLSNKQIIDYSVIAAVVLVIIIVIASSIRSKSKKHTRM
jgi:hypothetical protein